MNIAKTAKIKASKSQISECYIFITNIRTHWKRTSSIVLP